MTTSSDGYLTVTASDPTASILITVDFRTAPGIDASYKSVTVRRADGTIVRGLDATLAPGGMARGIDHESPLGAAAVYTASVTNGATTITSTTAMATSGIAATVSWLKSLRYPALSVALEVSKAPDWSDDIPSGVIYPVGSAVSGVVMPSVTQGQRQGDRGSMIVDTETIVQRNALLALLRSPGPYLLQMATNSGEPDQYVAVGAVSRAWVVDVATEPWRVLTLPLTAVARPPTAGSQVAIPGHTYADSLVAWPLYSNRTGTYGSR